MKLAKRLFGMALLVGLVCVSSLSSAQSPDRLTYQAIVRNPSGALLANNSIGVQVSIVQGDVDGMAVYVETHSVSSNANAVLSFEIGGGTPVSGDFSNIDWANGPYFCKTETDLTGGTNYTLSNTSQLLSVPYAMHSKTADALTTPPTEGDPIFQDSPASEITPDDIESWNNSLEMEFDPEFASSPAGGITNEDIEVWNSALTNESDPEFNMSPAGSITNEDIVQWNNALTDESDPDFNISPAGTITNENIDQWNNALSSEADPNFSMSPAGSITNENITQWNNALSEEVDGDPENELQELSMNGDTLFISNGNYIVIPGISGLVEENTEPANVQERLNAGETPFEIYTSDNTLLDSLWGKQYGGGLIFYMDTDTGEGMVCAEEDQSTFQYWYNCIFVITGATDQSIGSGPANTATIIDVQGIGTYAARTCDNLVLNGFEDWYLPSKDELFQMFIVLGMNDLGNFAAEAYHSSSEDDTNNAWVCHFSNGAQYASSKLNFHYVRAVRSF